ncbi:MAG: hypothetical protein EU551_00745 [Promethearchaeota archaeon]|nr:MAG: hypothetical protein EU551_00745 [Candidatus Lokiarchaeota archaeon]
MISAIVIPIVFIAMIILWLWNKVDQMLVSLGGAIISIFSLLIDGTTFSDILGFFFGTPENDFINFHSLLLSLGMLFMINTCQETGVFSYLAFKLVQTTGGNRYQLFIILSILAFMFSAILNNILAVLLFIPLIITICKILKINPIPYIISISILVNLGSILFAISSVPNILISTHTGWTFSTFFIQVGLFAFILILVSSIFLSGYYKKNLEKPNKKLLMVLKEYDAWIFVTNRRNFYKSLIVLITSIILFIFLPLFTPITIDIIAISGGILLIFLTANDELTSLMRRMDFELVFYLIGVFFVVDALSFTGALNFVSEWLIFISQGNLLISSLIILWLSSGLSSLMNNTPVTKIMIPAIDKLATRFAINPNIIFTSLAYGTNLGDNLTPWGDNLVAMKISSNYKRPINFWKFFKIGVLATVIQLFATTIYLIIIINPQFLLIGVLILLAISITIILIYFHKGIYKVIKEFINNTLNRIR